MVVFKKEEEQNIDFRNLFKSLLKIYEVQNAKFTTYRIVGKFGGGEIWQTDIFQAFGKRKFGKLIDEPIGY